MANNKPSAIPNSMRNFSKEFPYIGGAIDIFDERKNKHQQQINKETDDTLADHYEHLTLHDAEEVKKILYERTLQHWKKIKNGNSQRFAVWLLNTWRYIKSADMLGVRETFRANCERMLNENSFYTKISSSNIATGENLDKKIAFGCHIVDVHGDDSIDGAVINASMQPYGVPYGVLLPKKLKNVIVASRGSGMTHIGASSFRGNKNVGMLGYAGGCACLYALQNELTDLRNVNVETLQGSTYTGFADFVTRLENYIS